MTADEAGSDALKKYSWKNKLLKGLRLDSRWRSECANGAVSLELGCIKRKNTHVFPLDCTVSSASG